MAETDFLQRYRLSGDEDCGVGLHCCDCWDGGRPLAYYGDDRAYSTDPKVKIVADIAGLIEAAKAHERESHGG